MKTIERVLYKAGSGESIPLPLHHLAVFGVTEFSGKTTFIEAAVHASGLRAITFRTKRGELGFDGAEKLPLYFEDAGLTHWKSLEGLISSTLDEKVEREPGMRSAIIGICNNPSQAKTLQEIYDRVDLKLEDPKIRGFVRDVFVKLKAYLDIVLPQLSSLHYTNKLELGDSGVYVMDLEGLTDEVQNLILANVIRKVYEELSNVIVVVPEVWKFLPQDRGSPVKWAFEKLLREGRSVGNYVWLDAQDLRGVDKKHLRSIDTRLFGRQPDELEVKEVLDALPLPKQAKPKQDEIMTLRKGHFYAKLKDKVLLVYARPAWLPEEIAVKVAEGYLDPDSDDVQKYRNRHLLAVRVREKDERLLQAAVSLAEDWSDVHAGVKEVEALLR